MLAGLSNAKELAQQASLEIIPLKIGNSWTFTDDEGLTEEAVVQGEKGIAGKVWYSYRELSDDAIFIVRNTYSGQIELDPETNEEELVLPYPVEQETFYTQFGVQSKVTPNVEVTVPVGTFKAYLYDFSVDDPGEPILLWIVPGLGPIKSVYEGEIFELKEYTIN